MASWTTKDAEASRQKVAAGTALTADPDADRWAMIRAFAVTLADFWAAHKYDFSKFWIELDADARRNLLLTVSPAMPKSVDDPRSTAGEAVPIAPLVPELNLADLTVSARAMLALFGQRALGVDALWDLQTADIVYAQKVMDLPAATQFLARDARRRAEGEWLPVDSGAGPPDPNLQLFDAHFVRGMLEREMFLCSTLASVADEYRREVLKDTDVCVASAPAWAGPGLAHCAAADGGRLGEIVARCGFPDYLAKDVADDSACAALCRIIVGQQLAGAAAAKIWARTSAALCPGGFAAAAVAAAAGGAAELPDDLRQACGLSRAKAKAVVGVARAFLAGDLSDELLATAPVDELRSRLCALNGVGPWSCDMYLIFHLKKADVLPLGDLGVRAGAARAFGVRGRGKNGALDMKKDADVLEALFAPYAPYRSLAAYYMWRVVDTKAFNQDADA